MYGVESANGYQCARGESGKVYPGKLLGAAGRSACGPARRSIGGGAHAAYHLCAFVSN